MNQAVSFGLLGAGGILLTSALTQQKGETFADALRAVVQGKHRTVSPTASAGTAFSSVTSNGVAGIGSGIANAIGGVANAPLIGAATTVPGHPELKPQIAQITNVVLAKFPGLQITSTISGTHADHSYHYIGEAVDISGPPALMDQAAAWISQNLSGSLLEGIHNGGSAASDLSVKNTKSVSDAFWGAVTWAGHTNHIHLAAGTQAP
jgi:hypothetical protein